MLNPLGDVGHDLRQLRLSIRTVALGEHPHRRIVFSDAVDPAGQVILGAEGGLEKSVGDLAVGECLLFSALTRCNRRNFSRRNWRPGTALERDAGQSDREYPQQQGSIVYAHRADAAATVAPTQSLNAGCASGSTSRCGARGFP